MFCWSCGKRRPGLAGHCEFCGAEAARTTSVQGMGDHLAGTRVSMCPGCGYLGQGIPYFRRTSHGFLLVGAVMLTYGIGGLIYWLVKRGSLVCPSCGLSWDRARQASEVASFPADSATADRGRWPRPAPVQPESLPRGGLFRRMAGAILAIFALYLLGMGIVGVSAEAIVASLTVGLIGASSFAWGWRALQRRREGLLRSLQTRVLWVAAARGGRITATDVASDLEVTLPAAERVLFSLDDGFRVCSDVTDEGLLVFDFPEIQARELPGANEAASKLQPTEPAEDG